MSLVFELERTYHKEWTTGIITLKTVVLSYSIELPWKDNQINISCIPEGLYEIEIRRSEKFKEHIWVKKVENREWILLHPANDARKELSGCIAPVLILKSKGRGSYSRLALNLLILNIQKNKSDKTYLRIFSKKVE